MKVTIVSACFPPEPMTSANTAADLAKSLAERGHTVTVFAPFPNRPTGRIFDGFRRKWRLVRRVDGYLVNHCWHSLSRSSKFVSRLLENLTFGVSSSLQLLVAERPNVVYMNTWPFLSQNLNAFIFRRLRVPVVTIVQDVYPESLVEKGLLKPESFLARLMTRVDAHFLKRCALVFAISPGMANSLERTRSLPSGQVVVIPNWIDDSNFAYSADSNNEFRRKHNIPADKFVAIFAGSLTLSASVEMYVKVAEILVGHLDILILLVGDGSLRWEVERQITEKGLNNIRVIYPFTPQEAPVVQGAADVLLLSLKGTMTHSAAPSKQISYMFSGRPIIAAVPAEGYPAQLVSETDCGVVVPPESPEAIAEALLQLASDRSKLSGLGDRARIYAEANFSKNMVLPKLIGLIESAGTKGISSKVPK